MLKLKLMKGVKMNKYNDLKSCQDYIKKHYLSKGMKFQDNDVLLSSKKELLTQNKSELLNKTLLYALNYATHLYLSEQIQGEFEDIMQDVCESVLKIRTNCNRPDEYKFFLRSRIKRDLSRKESNNLKKNCDLNFKEVKNYSDEIDKITSADSQNMDNIEERLETKKNLKTLLPRFNERDLNIVKEKIGYDMSYRELAKRYNISPQRCSQICERFFRKLQSHNSHFDKIDEVYNTPNMAEKRKYPEIIIYDRKFTFRDPNGRVWKERFKEVLPFREGLARVELDDGSGKFVNKYHQMFDIRELARKCGTLIEKPESILEWKTEDFKDEEFIKKCVETIKGSLTEKIEQKDEVDDDYANYCKKLLTAVKGKIERERVNIEREQGEKGIKDGKKQELINSIKDFGL